MKDSSAVSQRVQVPHYFWEPKSLIIGYLDPLGINVGPIVMGSRVLSRGGAMVLFVYRIHVLGQNYIDRSS